MIKEGFAELLLWVSLIVGNDGFATALDLVFRWSHPEGQPGRWTAGLQQESGGPQGTRADSAESFPHRCRLEMSSASMTQLTDSPFYMARCPNNSVYYFKIKNE